MFVSGGGEHGNKSSKSFRYSFNIDNSVNRTSDKKQFPNIPLNDFKTWF